MQHAEGGAFLEAMARGARKAYLSLAVVTQDVRDFLDDPHGRAVLNNAALKLVLRQDASTVGVLQEALHMTGEERRLLLGAEPGEGLFLAGGNRVVLRAEASPLERRLITTAPRELQQMAVTEQRREEVSA